MKFVINDDGDDDGDEVGPDWKKISLGWFGKIDHPLAGAMDQARQLAGVTHPLNGMFGAADVLKLTGAGSPLAGVATTLNKDMLGIQGKIAGLTGPILAAQDQMKDRLTDHFGIGAGTDLQRAVSHAVGPILDAQHQVAGFGADFQTKIADSLGPIIDSARTSLQTSAFIAPPEIPDYSNLLKATDTVFRLEAEEREATIETARLMRSLIDETIAARTETAEVRRETAEVRHEMAQMRAESARAFDEERVHRIAARRIAVIAVLVAVLTLVGTSLAVWAAWPSSTAHAPPPVHVQHVTTVHPTTGQVRVPDPLGSLLGAR